MKHVVQFSGGAGSWAAAKRVAERYGTDDLILLFADTMMEDEDLYRFLEEAAANVGGELIKIADGRTPWEVFFDERFLGNSRIDPCSKLLKRKPLDRWMTENCDPAETVLYFGIDWTEIHRFEGRAGKPGIKDRMAAQGWKVEAPMCEAPWMDKADMLAWLKREGIRPPRLYDLGFPHNNCGGFCVKAGQGHFKRLWETMPERYAFHEAKEQELREYLGKDVTILKNGLTLRAFREKLEVQDTVQLDLFEWGGCGCALAS